MRVWILTCNVDLGVSIEGVYGSPEEPTRLAAERSERDRVRWTGSDGLPRSSPDKWHVEEHEVADGVKGPEHG